MTKTKKCPHKSIIITEKHRYNIPIGWEKLQEKDDIDLGKYFIEATQSSVYCEDCDKYLEDYEQV